jgi:heptosyltransferase-2
LVRGVNWLGDAVMCTPALLRLREGFPRAHITLLTPAKLSGLWTGHPALDAVEEFTADEGAWKVGRRLRGKGFDLALILPNSPRSAIEMWLAGIPRRVGLARPWRNWFLTQAIPPRAAHVSMRKRTPGEVRVLLKAANPARFAPPPEAHHLHQYLHLTAALGANPAPVAPLIAVSPEERAGIQKRVGTWDQPLVGLVPGAEYGPAKRWPEEKFIAAATEIQTQTGAVMVLLGGKGDTEIAARIVAALPGRAINLAGATTLRELCAALQACRVVVANDTGPMHLAAAVGTPVVGIFGSTSPELTGPGLPGDPRHCLLAAEVPCRPCFLRACPVDFRCMGSLAADAVAAAALARMR